MKMLEDRREKVARGVRDAQAAEEKLSEIERTRAATLAVAGKEGDSIVAAARAAGTKKEQDLLHKGEAAAASVLRDAQAQAEELKAHALEESKHEVAKLIVLGMEKAMKK